MEYYVPIDSVIERTAEAKRFSSFNSAKTTLNKINEYIISRGYVTFKEVKNVLDIHKTGVPFAFRSLYGWRTLTEAKPVHVPGYGAAEEYWYISFPRPKKLFGSEVKYPEFANGDEIVVKEFTKAGVVYTSSKVRIDGNAGEKYMAWNRTIGTGRHTPDYVEFVAEYPTHIDILAHFESNGGESYCESIDKYKIQSGVIQVDRVQ